MPTYAEDTSVSTSKSVEEIQRTLQRFGAADFAITQGPRGVLIQFAMKNRLVKFTVLLPPLDEFARTPERRTVRSKADQLKAWDQACRQRYRALLLCIKAKLEAVESGIETFDEAFLSHLVLPSGDTIGKWYGPQVELIYSGKNPPQLPSIIEDKRD